MTDLPHELVFGGTAFVLAALLTFALCLTAVKARFGLDAVSARSNHQVPTPRTGGLMVLGGWLCALAVLAVGDLIDPATSTVLMLTFLAGGLGLVDDFISLPAWSKLLGQAVLAAAAVLFLGPQPFVPVPIVGWIEAPDVVAVGLSMLWIVGMMNVVNFMDGLNGLVGSYGVLALALASALIGGTVWPILVVEAALVGFLACNVFRGRIFLGDAGSLSLGFLIAVSGLLVPEPGHGFWLFPLVALPLILDVAVTLIKRWRRGEDLTEAHREHAYQRLKAKGWSHQSVALGLIFSTLTAAVVGMALGPLAERPALHYWTAALFIGCLWTALNAAMGWLKAPAETSLEGTLR